MPENPGTPDTPSARNTDPTSALDPGTPTPAAPTPDPAAEQQLVDATARADQAAAERDELRAALASAFRLGGRSRADRGGPWLLAACWQGGMAGGRRSGRVLQFFGSWVSRDGAAGQVAGRGRAARRVNAATGSSRQGQVAEIRRWRRRPPRVMRAAACNSR